MEATYVGFRMWTQAVAQAGTTDVNAVRQAMYGQRVKAPSGFEEVMNLGWIMTLASPSTPAARPGFPAPSC